MKRVRILIKRNQAMGDVILVSACLRRLREKFHSARIDFATNGLEVSDCNPWLDGLFKPDHVTPSNYDLIYDLNNAYEDCPLEHRVDAFASKCGLSSDPNERYIEFYPNQNDFKFGLPDRPFVAFHTGPTGWSGRDWSLSKFDEVVTQAKALGFYTVAVGSGDNLVPPGIDTSLVRFTTVSLLGFILSRAAAFVGIDTFPAHLAQAMMCPSVVLFGTTSPQYVLTGKNAIGVTSGAHCSGLHHRLPPPVHRSECDGECMKGIEVDQVVLALKTLLS